MTEDRAITLFVADDQTTVREALAVMLDLAEDVTVVATATNGAEAVAAAEQRHPDLFAKAGFHSRADAVRYALRDQRS